MNTKRRDRRCFGGLASSFLLATMACSGGGGKGSASGLASGTACVTVGSNAEVCASSGVTANRTIDTGSSISITVSSRGTGTDCFDASDDTFGVTVSIPDGVPLPYQATNRPGNAVFGSGSCYWVSKTASVISGTIFHTATDGGLNVEGDVTAPYSPDNAEFVCGDGCPGTISARFRFNVPL